MTHRRLIWAGVAALVGAIVVGCESSGGATVAPSLTPAVTAEPSQGVTPEPATSAPSPSPTPERRPFAIADAEGIYSVLVTLPEGRYRLKADARGSCRVDVDLDNVRLQPGVVDVKEYKGRTIIARAFLPAEHSLTVDGNGCRWSMSLTPVG